QPATRARRLRGWWGFDAAPLGRQEAGKEAVGPGALLGRERRAFRDEVRGGWTRRHVHAAVSAISLSVMSLSAKSFSAKSFSTVSSCRRAKSRKVSSGVARPAR